ncbi:MULTISPECIES: hypothetical protein [unclassified Vibrio]|uniref:hypothetical protein n=1 Tax=unclassified Vibrio TaxID=2614977 RepID=UPI001131A5B6|nr:MULTISPECIES: hypothetical protein [unclassified Vibrio]NAW91706.1 hypothetical protein [Vibrio sp. V24_P1S3T111]
MNHSDLVLLEHHQQIAPKVWQSPLPKPLKSLLSVISTFYNVQRQSAEPSRKKIAAMLGVSVNHVSYLVAWAVRLGVLESKPQFERVSDSEDAHHRQTTNKYSLNLTFFGLYYNKAKVATKKRLRSLGYSTKESKNTFKKPQHVDQKRVIEQANETEEQRQQQIKESVATATGTGFNVFKHMKSSLFGKKPDK